MRGACAPFFGVEGIEEAFFDKACILSKILLAVCTALAEGVRCRPEKARVGK